jgi:hypothetical protein
MKLVSWQTPISHINLLGNHHIVDNRKLFITLEDLEKRMHWHIKTGFHFGCLCRKRQGYERGANSFIVEDSTWYEEIIRAWMIKPRSDQPTHYFLDIYDYEIEFLCIEVPEIFHD